MAKPPFQVRALYDYKSPHEDDLSFPNAQIITVIDEEDGDWYYGEYEDGNGKKQEGLFPRNFVKSYEPETPPRPNRQKAKRDPEPPTAPADVEEPKTLEDSQEAKYNVTHPQDVLAAESKDQEGPEDIEPDTQLEPATSPPPAQTPSEPPPTATPSTRREAKPTPPIAAKGPPPPVTEKPASGSFRDRINAFNKSSAPPPAPSKPAGLGASAGSSFIKKPFVAPPPSKNAYVPPPRQDNPHKVYRREEDPEVVAQVSRDPDEEDSAPLQTQSSKTDESEDQPKPTSLKERIALLQRQQAEQASRHADKKERAKRPPKKQEVEQDSPEHDDEEGEELEPVKSTDTTSKRSIETPRDARSSAKPRKSREETSLGSSLPIPPKEVFSDGNDADQSGAADTGEEEDQSTGRDDSDDKPRRQSSIVPQQSPLPSSREDTKTAAEVGDEDAEEEEEEEEEDEVDPEVRRRMEIRERMAKMSGGMGMAGMFGPPGGMSQPRGPIKQGTGSSERKMSGSSKSDPVPEASSVPPVPIMAMPGLAKVRSPETAMPDQGDLQVEKESSKQPSSTLQGKQPEDMPDVEDLTEKPATIRKSTDRAAPPPPPSKGKMVCLMLSISANVCRSRSSSCPCTE